MEDVKKRYINNPVKYKQLVWDYKMQPQTFFAILEGKKEDGWFNRNWAIARVLEHANYYEARELIPMSVLVQRWPDIKRRLFQSSIKEGYEYLLHRYALSSAR